MPTKDDPRITFRLDRPTHERLLAEAERLKVKPSEYVRQALVQKLEPMGVGGPTPATFHPVSPPKPTREITERPEGAAQRPYHCPKCPDWKGCGSPNVKCPNCRKQVVPRS